MFVMVYTVKERDEELDMQKSRSILKTIHKISHS